MKFLLSTLFFLGATHLHAATTLKIAAMAPEGTTWAENLKKMADEVGAATNGEVKIKLYLGGVAGDEPDVLRKIRVGQLNGGVFTGKTLGEIYGDFRILEVPFNFTHDRDKALKTLDRLKDHFNKGFQKNGFTNLAFFEVGKVYIVATRKVASIDEMKGVKIWAWEGDPLIKAMLESLELVTVPLALPDVMTALSTGMIEAAYASPLGIVALQWQSKVKYLIDYPVAFAFSAFLIDQKSLQKISPKNLAILRQVNDKYAGLSNARINQENEESLVALKKLGVESLKFPDKDVQKALAVRKKVLSSLTGPLFSKETVALFAKEVP